MGSSKRCGWWSYAACFLSVSVLLSLGLPSAAAVRDKPLLKESSSSEGTDLDLYFGVDNAMEGLLTGFMGGNHSVKCVASCNDDKSSFHATYTEEHNDFNCWGTFWAFCKPENKTIRARAGLKCEGHFLIANLTKAGVAACEGAVKQFAAAELPHPKTGASGEGRAVGFKTSACIGTSSAIWKAGNSSMESALASKNSKAVAEAGLTQAPGEFLAADQDQDLDSDVSLEIGSLGDDRLETVGQERCHGFSVKTSGVKTQGCGATQCSLPETAQELEDFAEGALGKNLGLPVANVSSIAAYQPGQQTPTDLLRMAPHMDCGFTCNQKPAWLHGNLPCFGKFAACCSSEDRHGRLGFDGSCKGFYSGWLGHVCKGFTSEHLVLEPREEGKKTVEVRSFCVGTHGAVAKKRRSGFGMAAWCHGQSIRAIQVEADEDDE